MVWEEGGTDEPLVIFILLWLCRKLSHSHFCKKKRSFSLLTVFLATFLKMNEGNSQMPKTVVMRKKDFSRTPRWWWSFLHALLKHFQNDKRAQIELKKKGDRAELIAQEQISDYKKKILSFGGFCIKIHKHQGNNNHRKYFEKMK